MKKNWLILICLCLAAMAACGCSGGSTIIDGFVRDATVRLEVDGEKVFVFDDNNCQLSYNEKRCQFRAHSDTMLNYFCVDMDHIPSRKGESAVADIFWSTVNGERSRNDITLYVRSIEGDVIWLCDSSRHTAAVVRVLK